MTTTTFQQTTSGTFGIFSGVYLWSNVANWTGGLPTNGSTVVWNFAGSAGNPAGYDDIANLYLDTLTLTSGYLAISAALTVAPSRSARRNRTRFLPIRWREPVRRR